MSASEILEKESETEVLSPEEIEEQMRRLPLVDDFDNNDQLDKPEGSEESDELQKENKIKLGPM